MQRRLLLNLKKKLRKLKNQISISIATILLTTFVCAVANGNEFWLISENEYSSLEVDNNLDLKLSSIYDKGPKITLVSPNIAEKISAPVNIYLRFENSPNGIEPDMDSLIVQMKGLITLDITKRIKPFIKGKEINIENAKIPNGRHNIVFMIMDLEMNYSERLLSFIIN